MLVSRDILYRDPVGSHPALAALDIYFEPLQAQQAKRPVVVFVHGGGWGGGDKACFPATPSAGMPQRFVRLGYVFVSVNYRLAGNALSPDAGIPEMASDIAKALKWLSINGRRYGGRKAGFVLIGFSSGAHLAALVATHRRYLGSFRLRPSACAAVVAMDVPHYDVPLAMRILERENTGLPDQAQRLESLYGYFGKEPSRQETVSPASQLGPWLRDTAFLMVSAGVQLGHRQTFTGRMGEHFKDLLLAHEIRAEHLHLPDWEHASLVAQYGGELAARVEDFLSSLPEPST
jgi:acetyl esterase/lipase